MVEFKVVVSYGDGKTETVSVSGQNASNFIGLRIGDKVDGSLVGKPGYDIVITGGSDSAGFPMLRNIQGGGLVRVLLKDKKGIRKRVLRRGSMITESVVQINTAAVKKG
ncbi:MAG TPA: S6e family ribosomal protein [bacterium]|nr:S6e family ribosomal protein [bacterium]